MAHMAQLKNGIVTQVIVISNDVMLDENGFEQASLGIAFCKSLYGEDTEWAQTSYNATFGGKYAASGDVWDGTNFTSPVEETNVTA